jgi:transforming growth factor-beta-induced protein
MHVRVLALTLLAPVLVGCAEPSKPANNLIDVLEADGRFSTLVRIVRGDAAVRFRDFMTSDRDLTLFAPPDDAFDNLPTGELESILADASKVQDLLAHHLAEPTFSLADLKAKAASSAPVLATGGCCHVRLSLDDGQLMVNNAAVIEGDIEASNGSIHVVDQVIESVPT